MSKEHRDKILDLVKDIEYKHDTHAPVRTSQEASDIRGVSLSSGAKAIVLRGKKTEKRYLVVIPAHKRLDTKAVQEKVGEKVSFVTDVESEFGCVPGSVPPFGSVLRLQTYADEALEDVLNFNIGLLTESLRISKTDYLNIEKPIVGKFSE